MSFRQRFDSRMRVKKKRPSMAAAVRAALAEALPRACAVPRRALSASHRLSHAVRSRQRAPATRRCPHARLRTIFSLIPGSSMETPSSMETRAREGSLVSESLANDLGTAVPCVAAPPLSSTSPPPSLPLPHHL